MRLWKAIHVVAWLIFIGGTIEALSIGTSGPRVYDSFPKYLQTSAIEASDAATKAGLFVFVEFLVCAMVLGAIGSILMHLERLSMAHAPKSDGAKTIKDHLKELFTQDAVKSLFADDLKAPEKKSEE